jgi:hypothetical protein
VRWAAFDSARKMATVWVSRHFDYVQAKEIKFYLFATLFVLASILVIILKDIVSSEGTKLYMLCAMVLIITWVALSIINRIGALRKILKENDPSERNK